ncbi:GSCOCG00013541001-RA-CDS [Cotesia congregata]|nr:GSCOCG00013541001-RA-CDS [Cotesia congregata]
MIMILNFEYTRFSDLHSGCMAVMSTTWIASIAIFGSLVLPSGGYYFNSSGLLACDPFFARPSFRILACCCFYFPTTMVLMYCYGSAFHVNKLRLKRVVCVNTPEVVSNSNIERVNIIPNYSKKNDYFLNDSYCIRILYTKEIYLFYLGVYFIWSIDFCRAINARPFYIYFYFFAHIAHERRLSTSASRTMAAMSLGFIVMVTPWTIQEVVVACTGSKPPPFLDFLATWLALSNSFWNPFLYWLLNNHFRRISRDIINTKIFCRRKQLGPNKNCCATSTGGLDVCSIGGFDISGSIDRCSIDHSSLARCSTPSLVTPPLPWELNYQSIVGVNELSIT